MKVFAREPWNDTGLDVVQGETLTFKANGEWWDANYRSGPAGFAPPWYLGVFAGFLRCPHAGWFELVGSIGRTNRTSFAIGNRCQVVMQHSGRLYLFANDIRGFYRNNRDAIDVGVSSSSPGTRASA